MSVTRAGGFLASGLAAGLKSSGGRDLALVLNTGPDYAAAGVFTSNRVRAAPVMWSQQVLSDGRLRAVILNSGGANACTGTEGFADAHRTAEFVAGALRQAQGADGLAQGADGLAQGADGLAQGADWLAQDSDIGAIDVAVCSTGLIGVRLPMDKITAGVNNLVPLLSHDGGLAAAEAIMTTDSVPKQASVADEGWSIGGMAKGAGMLAPGLATMLVVLTTDAVVDQELLHDQLTSACSRSFDRIDSDGCMSTNDAVILMSNGASGVRPTAADFEAALGEICHDLAQQLLADAEGAAHTIAIEVGHAASEADAVQVGRAIARSNLFKCAVFGQDPNWGRVLAAVGTTGADFEPDRIDVAFNGVQVCRGGAIGDPRELVDLSEHDVHVEVDLRNGRHSATVWTNDLTYDYVKENAEYAT
jgi:glutamate N-acetyltransferase/amino-acid N-acetyltransferase